MRTYSNIKRTIFIVAIISFAYLSIAQKNTVSIDRLEEPTEKEIIIIERINYINQLRKVAAELFWQDFGKNDFIGTIVYFSDTNAYFINPEPSVLSRVSKYTVLSHQYNYHVLRLATPYDKPTYIIETVFEAEDGNKKNINYMLPILFCSSPEISAQLQQEAIVTQEWATSVLHEMFHQYQYKETGIYNYLNSFLKHDRMLSKDSMQGIFRSNQSFRDSIIKENDLLLKAINTTSIDEEKKYFSDFLKIRNKRRTDFYKQKKALIAPIEEIWEKLEGTALYIDAIVKQNLDNMADNPYLAEKDKYYSKTKLYKNFTIENTPDYISVNEAKHYFGATGINLVRLLEKNKVDYKSNFFKFGSMPLSTQLKYFYKI